ncbi:hypothetical protein AB0C87_25235 [Actinomadura sp. NPDC048021]
MLELTETEFELIRVSVISYEAPDYDGFTDEERDKLESDLNEIKIGV